MSWMMSAAQVRYSDDGRRVGNWRPHLMIYYPYLTAEALGVAGEVNPTNRMADGSGGAKSNILVVVPDFSMPEPARGGAR